MTALLLAVAVLGFSQGTILHGRVTGAETHAPLSGAQVYLPQINWSRLTSEDGFYSFDPLPPGEYQLVVRRLGYGQLDTTVVVVGGADSIRLDVALRSAGGGWAVWLQLAADSAACGSPNLDSLARWRAGLPSSSVEDLWVSGRSPRPQRLTDQEDCQRQVWRAFYYAMGSDSLRQWLFRGEDTIPWRRTSWSVVAWDDLRVVEFVRAPPEGGALRVILGPEQRDVWRSYVQH